MRKAAPYAKAVVGALVATLTSLATGLADSHLTAGELVGALLAGVTVLGSVYVVPNRPAR